MPILKGGVKHARGKKSEKHVSSIVRKDWLGSGGEADVFKVEVEIPYQKDKNRKPRVVTMAEKESRLGQRVPQEVVRQFELATELHRLNRKKKLGLRLLPSVRLVLEKGKPPKILSTALNVPEWSQLSAREKGEFEEDAERQTQILAKHGHYTSHHAFFPQLVSRKKRFWRKETHCIAIIGDFGAIHK